MGTSTVNTRTTISLPTLLAELVRGRRTIVGLAGVAFLAAVALGLTRKPSFTTEFTFIPQSSSEQGASSALAGLAGQFGIALPSGGEAHPPQFYADLLKTREVLTAVARDTVTDVDGSRKPVSEFLGVRVADSAVRLESTVIALRTRVVATSVDARTTGITTVRVKTRSARASYEMSQRLLSELNRFNQERRRGRANAERRAAEQQLIEVRASLRRIDDSLLTFKQGNRALGDASRPVYEGMRLEAEQQLRRDIVRSVAEQVEQAKIREVRETPVITIIDRPIVAPLRDPMGRVRTVFVWTFMATVIGIAFVLGKFLWRTLTERGDPSVSDLQSELRQVLSWRRS
jgi:uncharacterized protein involved in exopolysaccharide biosynthesis